nr:sugar efflux transporter [Paenibacillus fonticola]
MNRLKQTLSFFSIPNYGILMISILLLGICISFTYPFLSLFGVDEVGMSPSYLGLFMTVTAASSVLISTVLGRLSDKYWGRKWVIIVSVSAAIIGYILFTQVRNYYTLLIIAFLCLGTASSAFPQMFAYAREEMNRVRAKQADMAINTLRIFFSLAWVIGPAIAAVLLASAGFKGLFLAAAVTYGIVLFFVLIFLKSSDRKMTAPTNEPPIQLRKFLMKPRIAGALGSFILLSVASTMCMVNLPLYVTRTLQGSQSDVGLLFSVAAAVEIPLLIGVGILAAKYRKSYLIRVGALFAIAYYILVGFTPIVWAIVPMQFLSAVTVSIVMGLGISYFQDLLPHEPGTATTLYSNTSVIGNMLGGIIAGSVAEWFGFRAVFIVCAVMAAAAFLLMLTNREPSTQEIGESTPASM